MAAITTSDIAPSAPAEERMDPKRVFAFLAMVFGMFMCSSRDRSRPRCQSIRSEAAKPDN